MTEALRTPDERFQDLTDFPYTPNFTEDLPGFEGLRMAWIDEGPKDAEHTFLCLHGQPTWSYLYRSWIPPLTNAGHRVVAPDLFGFGRSDKPVDDSAYTFEFHRRSLLAFIQHLDLSNVTLVVHDWGGILGLTLPHEAPERYARLVVCNTILATGQVPPGKGFLEWREWVANNPDMAVDRLMGRACPRLSKAQRTAYGAPFPDVQFKGGVRRFPALVPIAPDDPGTQHALAALPFWRERWTGPPSSPWATRIRCWGHPPWPCSPRPCSTRPQSSTYPKPGISCPNGGKKSCPPCLKPWVESWGTARDCDRVTLREHWSANGRQHGQGTSSLLRWALALYSPNDTWQFSTHERNDPLPQAPPP